MDLIAYLENLNDDRKAAKLLGVKQRTVLSWRLGDRTPRPYHAAIIVRKTPVTYEGIYKRRAA